MILVDTSVWVDHLRRGDPRLTALLDQARVLMHRFIVGELACGNLAQRRSVLQLLTDMPNAVVADPDEVLVFIERHQLHGKGLGYVDMHLLASTLLTHDATLWTRDQRLHGAAQALRRAFSEGSADAAH